MPTIVKDALTVFDEVFDTEAARVPQVSGILVVKCLPPYLTDWWLEAALDGSESGNY
jgi:hypothetical protein